MGNEKTNAQNLREMALNLHHEGYIVFPTRLRNIADDLERKNAELQEDLKRIRIAAAATDHEVQQILGRALGYPPLYPKASDVDDGTVCVGDHVGETLAMEASVKIAELQAVMLRLPKIWRLDESGILVQDCPCAPGTPVWIVDRVNGTIPKHYVRKIELLGSGEWWIEVNRIPCSGFSPHELYSSHEAAQAAADASAGKDGG